MSADEREGSAQDEPNEAGYLAPRSGEEVQPLRGEIVDETGPGVSDGERVETFVQAFSWQHSGPLPTAGEFDRYERTLPGAADRIMRLAERAMDAAENEATHRHGIETKVVTENLQHQRRAQWIATVLAAIGLIAGITFIALGKNVQGLVALLIPLGAFVSRFLNRGPWSEPSD